MPGAFVAIAVAIAIEQIVRASSEYKTPLVSDVTGIEGGFPTVFWLVETPAPMPFTWATVRAALVPSFVYCMVGLIEGVMVAQVVADQTNLPNRNVNQNLVANGVAILVAGFFGTMGGSPMIGLAMLAVRSGASGRFRLSSVVVALFVLIVATALPMVVGVMPLAALTGVMVVIVVHTFSWHSLRIVLASCLPARVRDDARVRRWVDRKIDRVDAVIVVVVTALTLVFDLLVAIVVGVAIACMAYAYTSSLRTAVTRTVGRDEAGRAVAVYVASGPLFFANAEALVQHFAFASDPACVELHVLNATIFDYSAIAALNVIGGKYAALAKQLRVRGLAPREARVIGKMRALVRDFEIVELDLHAGATPAERARAHESLEDQLEASPLSA